jgi:O-antigen/teichoic acid export membrane protein
VLTVLTAAVYAPVIPLLSAIEGSGEVARVNHLRLIQGIFANLLTWAVIAGSGGLFAASIVFLVNALWGYGWLARNYPVLITDVFHGWRNKTTRSFAWMKEVWPMQWRIAVSWVSGYFIFQLFTPILFYYHGPAQAGKMGMSLVIANMLNNFAQVWLQANTPAMARAVTCKDWSGFDAMFGRIFLQSTAVSWAGSLAALAGLWLLSAYPLAQRFLSLREMAYLLAAFALTHMIGALAHYLRMHKQEPFMWLSVVGAILVASAIWYFGQRYGTTGVVISLFAINLVYGLPSALWLWLRLRRTWHQPAGQAGI